MRNIKENEYYKHFKGNWYYVYEKATHSETGEELVVYRPMYGHSKLFVRPLEMFLEVVDKDKYPNSIYEYRFTSRDELGLTIEEVKKEIGENN
ncbi:DUF1653 domain-containing protein [Clostridium hydrogeniformans]|uniref:DUF1653 domain-containing protein n=1 Tax=Clostridium hydrogeniformans TaxID=349933 RepID=UPI000689ABA7|nr:DUF1653 domain-containing protein [Clostridium hydrogeniformans]